MPMRHAPHACTFQRTILQQVGLMEPHTNAETAGTADHGRNAALWHEKTDKELNVIEVYKKMVQGLIYSPEDCSKYFALDAEPPVQKCWTR